MLAHKGQSGQYLLVVSLDSYKWYKSLTLDGVPMTRLAHKGQSEQYLLAVSLDSYKYYKSLTLDGVHASDYVGSQGGRL